MPNAPARLRPLRRCGRPAARRSGRRPEAAAARSRSGRQAERRYCALTCVDVFEVERRMALPRHVPARVLEARGDVSAELTFRAHDQDDGHGYPSAISVPRVRTIGLVADGSRGTPSSRPITLPRSGPRPVRCSRPRTRPNRRSPLPGRGCDLRSTYTDRHRRRRARRWGRRPRTADHRGAHARRMHVDPAADVRAPWPGAGSTSRRSRTSRLASSTLAAVPANSHHPAAPLVFDPAATLDEGQQIFVGISRRAVKKEPVELSSRRRATCGASGRVGISRAGSRQTRLHGASAAVAIASRVEQTSAPRRIALDPPPTAVEPSRRSPPARRELTIVTSRTFAVRSSRTGGR